MGGVGHPRIPFVEHLSDHRDEHRIALALLPAGPEGDIAKAKVPEVVQLERDVEEILLPRDQLLPE